VDADQVVGSSVALVRDGRIVAQYNAGFADRSAGKRIDDRSIFHWGSITKTLTAIAILQLRDRGKLELDDTVVRWVPELRQMHDPFGKIDSVTIRMLLSHSGGFQDSTWPYDKGLTWEPFEPTTWAQLVAMMPYQELLFEPGTRFGYSNPAFIYLARIVEQLTGDPWESYVQKNVFAPLGLSRSYFRATPYYLAGDRSHNYYVTKDDGGATRVVDNGADFDPGITIPNGGWNAPISDVARYVAFLTHRWVAPATPSTYDIVLARKTLEEMGQPVHAVGWPPGASDAVGHWVGLSMFVARRGEHTLYGHSGAQAGFRAFLYFNPKTSEAVIAAFNTSHQAQSEGVRAQELALVDQALDLIW
jgi:CubicO group peptidase (beta-lactamase class C family)